MKIRKILTVTLLALTLFFEALPYGAVLIFAEPMGEGYRELYSYFDLTPYGYANFAPFTAAVLTSILFVLSVFSLFFDSKRLYKAILFLSLAAAVISLGPLLYGIRFFSPVGAVISALLIAVSLVSFLGKGERL